MWTLAFGQHEDRTPTHGYEATREDAMTAFAKSWRRGMTKKRRTYEPRVFDGRIITSDETERIHKGVLEFERIEAISDPMRELIEDLWPELVHKLSLYVVSAAEWRPPASHWLWSEPAYFVHLNLLSYLKP